MRPEERAELLAYRDIFRAAPPGLPAQHRELGGALAIAFPPAPVREINRVLGAGLDPGWQEEHLDELVAWLLGTGATPCVSLAPDAAGRPALEARLRALGLAEGYAWQKFRHDGSPPLAATSSLLVEETSDPEAFGAGFVAGWGLPPAFGAWIGRLAGRDGWHCWVAREQAGGPAVACGALYISEPPAVAWLGLAATRPDLRGRGAQGAIFAARIRRAQELGCSDVITETGVPGPDGPGPSYRNMLRHGFAPVYVRPNWLPAAGA